MKRSLWKGAAAALLTCALLLSGCGGPPAKEGALPLDAGGDRQNLPLGKPVTGPVPVVIDCDPGTDDAYALALAASCEQLDIRAVCAVQGNAPLAHTGPNALALCAYLGIDCPVSQGAAAPLSREAVTAEYAHGSNGLGGVKLPDPGRAFDSLPAWDRLYQEAVAAGGELQVIALGPLTNVATALQKYPDLPQYLAKITAMGSSLSGGNITAQAEFNVYSDPEAWQVVLASGVPLTVVGLDVTTKTYLSQDNLAVLLEKEGRASALLKGIADYAATRSSQSGLTLNDALAVASVVNPPVVTTQAADLRVQARPGSGDDGKTTATNPRKGEGGNCRLALRVDNALFQAMLLRMMDFYAAG